MRKDKQKIAEYFQRWYAKPGNKEKQRKRVQKCNTAFRKERKQLLDSIKSAGCIICGYKKCMRALCFHHVDPTQKEDQILRLSSIEQIKLEIVKCVVLCHNCHTEVHAGLAILPCINS